MGSLRGSLSSLTLVLTLVTPRGATSFLKAMSASSHTDAQGWNTEHQVSNQMSDVLD